MHPGDLHLEASAADSSLQVYLLGEVDFPALLSLQRVLVYQIQERRSNGALVLCEHNPLITIGRQAGPGNIRYEPDELRARRWPVRWVNRGGGCWLHLPGQLAVYSVLALDRQRLGVQEYVERLQQLIVRLLDDFHTKAAIRQGESALSVSGRAIAEVGVAVRDWVAYFGLVLNLNPDLVHYRNIRTGGWDDGPMTSLERERRGRFSPSLVRERLIEYYAEAFPFDRTSLFFHHPLLEQKREPALLAHPVSP